MLVNQMATLEQQKKQLQQNILQEPKNASDKDLEELQDDIDFIKALSNNCLNGPTNPLLSSLATHDFISNKLNGFSGAAKKWYSYAQGNYFF